MDEPTDPLIPMTPASVDEDVREELKAARGVIILLLVAVTCMGMAMALYLYRQVVNLNRQVVENRRVANDYQSNSLPKISWFVNNLQAFAKTNPDFNPILAKYNLLPSATPPPGAANGPTPPTPTPKK